MNCRSALSHEGAARLLASGLMAESPVLASHDNAV
jgi:hypothetical protein